jgi:cob(I)alamin adenosyltransferase
VDPGQSGVTPADIARLENEIGRMNGDLPLVRSFVLAGSGPLNGLLHQCRVVCRRAERATVSLARQEAVPSQAVPYLNRLSDAFFVWSRWVSHVCREEETLWNPHHSAA